MTLFLKIKQRFCRHDIGRFSRVSLDYMQATCQKCGFIARSFYGTKRPPKGVAYVWKESSV